MLSGLLPHVLAHGIGGVQDLPVPKWLFFWGGAFVLVVSFIALGALWKTPQLERHAGGRPLGEAFSRLVLGPVRILVQALSAFMFVVIFAAALFGTTDPFGNIAPTWVYVIFWVGMPVLSLLLRQRLAGVQPVACDRGRLRVGLGARSRSPGAAAGRLPRAPRAIPRLLHPVRVRRARALLLEPCQSEDARVRDLALLVRGAVRDAGVRPGHLGEARARGSRSCLPTSDEWHRSSLREGRIRLRVPLTGLAGAEHTPGSVLFLAVALGSVGFDGFSRTITWQDLVARVEAPYVLNQPGTGELLVTGLNLLGLVAAIALVLGGVPRRLRSRPRNGEGAAFARARLRALARPDRARLRDRALLLALRDPGSVHDPAALRPVSARGGISSARPDSDPNIAIIGPNTIWYVQVAALVLGHVAGLAVAHDRAVTIFRDRQDALRSQYAMLALMVLYTVGGLWLLSHK